MQEEQPESEQESLPDRRMLIRDIAVFQVKLAIDGLRDLLLVPVSLFTGLVSLLRGGNKPGSEFYDLLKLGARSERWINLFEAANHMHGPLTDDDKFAVDDVDELVSRVESFVVDEYRKGGVTAQAKVRLDGSIDSLHRFLRRQQDNADDS